MKVTQRDGTAERQVMIGCIVHKKVLAAVAQKWKDHGLFSSRHANLVIGWAIAHFRKYGKSPKIAIQQYFHEWADTNKDAELVGAVGSLLSGLSADTERLKQQLTPDHLLDIAGKYFEGVRLKDLAAQMTACLERGDVEQAHALVEKSRKIELGLGSGIDVLTDQAALEAAFERRTESMLELPGAMGGFYGKALRRGGFVAWMAGEKKGKSYDLQDIAIRAVQQGLKVAYFEMGDDTREDVMIRFACRSTERPFDADGNRTKKVDMPVELESNDGEMPKVVHEYPSLPCITVPHVREVFCQMAETGRLRLWNNPAGTLSVTAADAILDECARDGLFADITIFDYADLAAPIDRKLDKLDQERETWMAMRSMSQKRHTLVLTATQCNREGFEARVLKREHIGGYHLKMAFVTGMVGINQTPKEKQLGLSRRNWVVGRGLEFGENRCVWYAGCLAIGQPCILSSF